MDWDTISDEEMNVNSESEDEYANYLNEHIEENYCLEIYWQHEDNMHNNESYKNFYNFINNNLHEEIQIVYGMWESVPVHIKYQVEDLIKIRLTLKEDIFIKNIEKADDIIYFQFLTKLANIIYLYEELQVPEQYISVQLTLN